MKAKLDALLKEHVNQTFEMNLEMKEEIENVREETLIKSEQLQILEKRYSQITHELDFFKAQNDELMKRLD